VSTWISEFDFLCCEEMLREICGVFPSPEIAVRKREE
jgi:hypothetical protein